MGEGPTEKAFIRYLSNCFLERESGISVKVESAQGGKPEVIIHFTKKKLRQRAYDLCLILMDGDQPWPEKWRERIAGTKMVYAKAEHCIEGVFLQILEPSGICTGGWDSNKFKSYFHSKYLSKKQKTVPECYHGIFPKDLILSKRSESKVLDVILNCFEKSRK